MTLDKTVGQINISNIKLFLQENICCGYSKKRFYEAFLMSTHKTYQYIMTEKMSSVERWLGSINFTRQVY